MTRNKARKSGGAPFFLSFCFVPMLSPHCIVTERVAQARFQQAEFKNRKVRNSILAGSLRPTPD